MNLDVAALITSDKQWNVSVVNELFPAEEAARVMEIPIGGAEDKHIWAYTDHGAYTVKSGYWFIANHPLIPTPPATALSKMQNKLKQRIWKIQAPPKIRLFWWRVVAGAVAVASRVNTRGLQLDPVCKLCNVGTETVNHVLFRCSVAQNIWDLTSIPSPLMGFGEENMEFLLNLMESSTLPDMTSGAIPWILWNIWKHRNSILFAGTQDTFQSVVNGAFGDAKCWKEIHNGDQGNPNQARTGSIHDGRWHKPLQNIVKCNVHGHWRNSRLHCGGSWIARDHTGSVFTHE